MRGDQVIVTKIMEKNKMPRAYTSNRKVWLKCLNMNQYIWEKKINIYGGKINMIPG